MTLERKVVEFGAGMKNYDFLDYTGYNLIKSVRGGNLTKVDAWTSC